MSGKFLRKCEIQPHLLAKAKKRVQIRAQKRD